MTQILAAIILAAGAYYGVYKGAVFAVGRLSGQLTEERRLSDERLDAEAERLQMQLDAEDLRLERRLAHDRWMREVEELRRLVDEAAAAGLAAGNAVHALRDPVWQQLETGKPGPLLIGARQSAISAVQGMQGFVERMELRLGRGHELPEAFSAWQTVMEEAIAAIDTSPPTRELLRKGGEMLTDSSEKYLLFMDASRAYVRLDPPDG